MQAVTDAETMGNAVTSGPTERAISLSNRASVHESAGDYATAVDELAAKDDKTARVAKAAAAASALLQPATSAADPYAFRNSPSGPAKPNGFA